MPPSHPISGAITIDLRPPAPHFDPKSHEQIWATMRPTDEIATCPTCGATLAASRLDVRRERHYRYVKCDDCGLAPVTATEPKQRDAESEMRRMADRCWAQLRPTRETAPRPACGALSELRRERDARGRGYVQCCGTLRIAALPAQRRLTLYVADLPAPQASPTSTDIARFCLAKSNVSTPQPTAEPTPVERVAQLITRRDHVFQIACRIVEPGDRITRELAAVVSAWSGKRDCFTDKAQAAAAHVLEVAKREGRIQ